MMELKGRCEDSVKVMEPRSRSLTGLHVPGMLKFPRTSEAGGKAEKYMEGQEDHKLTHMGYEVSFNTREKVEVFPSIQMSKGPAKLHGKLS